jgi:hypothetical protein
MKDILSSSRLDGPSGPRSSCLGFEITLRYTKLGRSFLGEGNALRRDLYLTISNTNKREKSMPMAGFKPTIPASERSQTYTLDSTATGSIVSIQSLHIS